MKRPSWERLVSDVVSPPVVWAILMFPVAFRYTQTSLSAFFWALLYGTFICLIPVLYVAYNVKRGNISDIHMKERRERFRPLLVSIASTAVVWVLLKLWGAPRPFPILAMLSLVQIGVIALITLYWQISMHMMSLAGAVVAVGIVFNVETALWLVPLVPIVAAARLNLQRHTPAQVLAGTVIGALLPVTLLGLLPLWMLNAF